MYGLQLTVDALLILVPACKRYRVLSPTEERDYIYFFHTRFVCVGLCRYLVVAGWLNFLVGVWTVVNRGF